MTMKFITRESEKTIAYATQNVKKKNKYSEKNL